VDQGVGGDMQISTVYLVYDEFGDVPSGSGQETVT